MEEITEHQMVLSLPQDINKICRTCMTATETQLCHDFLIVHEYELTETALKLEKLSFLKISVGDGLPNSICEQCANQLEIAYHFRLQCEKSEASLRDLLNMPVDEDFIKEELKSMIPSSGVILYDIENKDMKQQKLSDKESLPPKAKDVRLNEEDIFLMIEERKQVPEEESTNDESVDIKEEIDSDSELSYQCDNCDLLYPSRESFQLHIDQCLKFAPNPEMLNTILNLKEEMDNTEACDEYNCVICGAVFDNKYQRNGHMATHGIQTDKPQKFMYSCDLCPKSFSSESKLAMHFITHATKLNESYYSSDIHDFNDDGEEPSCYICDDKFSTSKQLSDHIKTEHMIAGILICEICGREYSKETAFAAHLRKHGLQVNLCKICLKKFDSRDKLKEHSLMHRTDEYKSRFLCPICKSQFETQKELKLHCVEHAKDSYDCVKCKKTFNNAISYEAHVKEHSEPRYLCSLCGKQYFSSVTLACHIRSHNNEKPFICPHCNKGFSSRATLSVHKRIHSSFKPYVCSYCGYSCRQSGDLAMHTRIHTGDKPYKCTFPNCDRKFTTSSQRKEHYRRHTNERNHKCAICQRAFLESKTLKVHMLTHTGEKPHPCEVCGRKFRRTHHLANHMKGHRDYTPL